MGNHELLDSFEKELQLLRSIADLKYGLFNFIGTFRLKRRFKMMPEALAHVAAASFVVEVRAALCNPAGAGKTELSHMGILKRVIDHENNTFGAIFIPSQKLIEEKKSFAGQLAAIRNRDGFDVIEQDAKSNLESAWRFDEKFRNLNLEYLLASMCAAISQNLLKGTAIHFQALGEFKPDLTFEPDQLLIASIKGRCNLRKSTEPLKFYRIDE